MPYPAQIDRDTIVAQARRLIREQGVEALTLAKLARALGVKAPSLYRHVANKQALLVAVNLDTLNDLFEALAEARRDATRPSSERLLAVLRAFRQYALTHPSLYQLAMTSPPGDGRPEEEMLVQMVLPLQALMADVVGEADSLSALRGAVALAHGFVMLEINQQLQRGGDLEAAFVASAEAYLRGWQLS